MLHTTLIMLGVAQIRQLGPSRPLGRPLDNLNPRHVPTVHLEPHLHPDPAQLSAEQDGRLDPAAPDTHQHAGKGLGGAFGRDHEDVAYAGGVLVVFGKESCAGARGVHFADLVVVVGLYGRREGPFEVGVGEGQVAEGGFGGGVDGEAGAVEGRAGLDAVGFVDEAVC